MDDPAINQTQESQETTPVPPTTPVVKDPATRFRGIGTNFRAKLIGIDDVNESRGDRMCQDSILKLKAAVKASGQHKQKIIINVSLDGLKIVDLLSGEIQQEHKVNRISFIARDLTDRRAFGYIYGTNDGKHQFFGIKTSKIAEHLVLALRDLFQVVYDMKKDEIAMKTEAVEKGSDDVYAVPNNRPAVKRSDGSLVDLKQQMQNMQQMSGLDAFTPWPENTPVSPDTSGSPSTNEDLFGMANLSDISSLSSDFSLASATCSAQDTPKSGEKYLKSNSYSPQNLHRSSSGKSAKSWQGSSNHWFQRSTTRHSSMSGGNRKNSFPSNFEVTLKEEISSKSNDQKCENSETIKPPASPVIIDSGQTKDISSENISQDSFFDEVMGAVSASLSPTHENVKQEVGKDYTTDDDHSSASSVTSADSKRKMPQKSLSIASFFSNSIKKKNKKLTKQTPVSLSNSSELNTSNVVMSKSLSNKSINSTSVNTISNNSLNSTHELTVKKLSRGLSVTSIASAPDIYRNDDSPKTRVPPSLAVARARPRKNPSLQRQSSGSSSNPPMFKNKSLSNDKISSSKSINLNEDEKKPLSRTASTASSSGTQSRSTNMPLWASFDETEQKETISEKNNTAELPDWCSFDQEDQSKFEQKDTCTWAETNTEQNDKNITQNPFSSDFSKETETQVDPFAAVTFLDPFAELDEKSPVEEDPFADIEGTFGFASDNKLPVVHEIDDEKTDKTPDSNDNLSDNNILSDLPTDNSLSSPSKNFAVLSSEDNWITATEIESSGSEDYKTTSAPPQSLPPDLPPPSTPPPLLPPKYVEPILLQSDPDIGHHSDSSSPPSTPPFGPPPELPQMPPPIVPPRIPSRPVPKLPENNLPPPSSPPPPLPQSSSDSDENSQNEEEDYCSDKNDAEPPSFPPPALPSLPDTQDHDDLKNNKSSGEEINNSSAELHGGDNIPLIQPPPRTKKHQRRRICSYGSKKLTQDTSSGKSQCSSASSGSISNPSDAGYLGGSSASSEFNAEARNGSYGNDLAALSIDAVQPAAAPGAKKTKDQILAEFGAPGMGGPGMFQQQQMAGMYQQQQNPYMAQQQMGMHANPFPGQQQGMYGGAPVPSVPAANPFAASAYGAPAVAAPMFRGPSPAIPARPGAMRPPVSVVAPSGAPQNPFGDAIGGGSVSNGLIEPINLQGGQQNEESSEQKGKSDPFASLLPGMGGGSTNKKDMFKDFQMVKPEPPPRTSDSVSANFDNYLRNSVGGVPVKPTEMNNNAPVAAPRTSPAQAAGNEGGAPSDDPFGMFANNSSNFLSDNQQQQNNMQSLFG